MHVHITYTGGTIGMVDSPHGLVPGADLEGWLTSLLEGTPLARSVSVTSLDRSSTPRTPHLCPGRRS